MVALNFKSQFASDVITRKKRQSIRGRKIKVGENIQLCTGQRTKACKKLVQTDPICVSCRPIIIARNYVKIDGEGLSFGARRNLALSDGFVSIYEFLDFFCPAPDDVFEGFLIKWGWA